MKTRLMSAPAILALVALTALSAMPRRAMATPPEPALPAPPPPPPPAPAAVKRSTVALWAAGVAVVGAGVATTFGILALQNKSAYERNPTYSNVDNGTNDAAYADGGIALAVAAGITSLVLFLTSDASPDARGRSAGISASPVLTAHGAGAGAILRF